MSLNGIVYEVDAALVGQKVTLRFEPGTKGRPVQVWYEGRYIEGVKPLDAYLNCFVRRHRPSGTLAPDTTAPEPPSGLAPRNLNDPNPDTEPR
ncbi:MAG: hypothetical protein ACREV4_03585 [Gammaproteobacteria bacterium]